MHHRNKVFDIVAVYNRVSPMIQRRINRMSRTQRKFFYTLLEKRLHLADEYEDTPHDQIVHDCLNYAEVKGLDIKRELDELSKPIPATTYGQSSAGWAMTRTQE